MTDFEIASFYLHWVCHAHETLDRKGYVDVVTKIRQTPRFVRLPEIYRGQIEGFAMGLLAKVEGLV